MMLRGSLQRTVDDSSSSSSSTSACETDLDATVECYSGRPDHGWPCCAAQVRLLPQSCLRRVPQHATAAALTSYTTNSCAVSDLMCKPCQYEQSLRATDMLWKPGCS
jgi:hypothetical protein